MNVHYVQQEELIGLIECLDPMVNLTLKDFQT